MPSDLFGDVVRPRISVGTRKWYTVPLSLVAHVAVIIPAILVPLMAADVLPSPYEYRVFIPEAPLPPEPPRQIAAKPIDQPAHNPAAAPIEAPSAITPERPSPDFELPTTPDIGVIPGLGDGKTIERELPVAPPAPPPVKPVVPGGKIKVPTRLTYVAPAYPTIAMQARVEGTVILQAVIGIDGNVEQLKVLRSIPFLDQAALDAVKQWTYSPTLLNGMPVPVVMTVTVTFTLTK